MKVVANLDVLYSIAVAINNLPLRRYFVSGNMTDSQRCERDEEMIGLFQLVPSPKEYRDTALVDTTTLDSAD